MDAKRAIDIFESIDEDRDRKELIQQKLDMARVAAMIAQARALERLVGILQSNRQIDQEIGYPGIKNQW